MLGGLSRIPYLYYMRFKAIKDIIKGELIEFTALIDPTDELSTYKDEYTAVEPVDSIYISSCINQITVNHKGHSYIIGPSVWSDGEPLFLIASESN